MTDNTLKPCAHCGGAATSYHHTPRGIDPSWHVECDDCGCGTCHHETKAEAIAAWNTRAEASSAEPVADLAGYERGQREAVERIVAELRGMHPHHKWVLPEVADLIEAGEWKP